jgi:hypothetical protein
MPERAASRGAAHRRRSLAASRSRPAVGRAELDAHHRILSPFAALRIDSVPRHARCEPTGTACVERVASQSDDHVPWERPKRDSAHRPQLADRARRHRARRSKRPSGQCCVLLTGHSGLCPAMFAYLGWARGVVPWASLRNVDSVGSRAPCRSGVMRARTRHR